MKFLEQKYLFLSAFFLIFTTVTVTSMSSDSNSYKSIEIFFYKKSSTSVSSANIFNSQEQLKRSKKFENTYKVINFASPTPTLTSLETPPTKTTEVSGTQQASSKNEVFAQLKIPYDKLKYPFQTKKYYQFQFCEISKTPLSAQTSSTLSLPTEQSSLSHSSNDSNSSPSSGSSSSSSTTTVTKCDYKELTSKKGFFLSEIAQYFLYNQHNLNILKYHNLTEGNPSSSSSSTSSSSSNTNTTCADKEKVCCINESVECQDSTSNEENNKTFAKALSNTVSSTQNIYFGLIKAHIYFDSFEDSDFATTTAQSATATTTTNDEKKIQGSLVYGYFNNLYKKTNTPSLSTATEEKKNNFFYNAPITFTYKKADNISSLNSNFLKTTTPSDTSSTKDLIYIYEKLQKQKKTFQKSETDLKHLLSCVFICTKESIDLQDIFNKCCIKKE